MDRFVAVRAGQFPALRTVKRLFVMSFKAILVLTTIAAETWSTVTTEPGLADFAKVMFLTVKTEVLLALATNKSIRIKVSFFAATFFTNVTSNLRATVIAEIPITVLAAVPIETI
jgi:hypothetical protein